MSSDEMRVSECVTSTATVDKYVEVTESSVAKVEFVIRLETTSMANVRLVDTLPDDWPTSRVGFHPEHNPDCWHIADGEVVYEAQVEPSGEHVAVYGLKIDEVAELDEFDEPPRIDVSPVEGPILGDQPDDSGMQPNNAGHRSENGPEIRAADRTAEREEGTPMNDAANEFKKSMDDTLRPDDDATDDDQTDPFEEFNRQFDRAEESLDIPKAHEIEGGGLGDPADYATNDIPEITETLDLVDPTSEADDDDDADSPETLDLNDPTSDTAVDDTDSTGTLDLAEPTSASAAEAPETTSDDSQEVGNEDGTGRPTTTDEEVHQKIAGTEEAVEAVEQEEASTEEAVEAVEQEAASTEEATEAEAASTEDAVEADEAETDGSARTGSAGTTVRDSPASTSDPDTDLSDDPNQMVDALVEALEGPAGGEARSALRSALGVGTERSLEKRVDHLQSEVNEVSVYKDALREFINSEGTGTEVIESMQATQSELENDLEDVADRLETVANVRDDVTATTERVDEMESRLDGLADVPDRIDEIRDEIASLERRQEERVDDVEDAVDERTETIRDDLRSLERTFATARKELVEIRRWQTELQEAFGQLAALELDPESDGFADAVTVPTTADHGEGDAPDSVASDALDSDDADARDPAGADEE